MENNSFIMRSDIFIFDKSGTILEGINKRDKKSLKMVRIPMNVTTTGPGAFQECLSLRIVIFGNNVKSIGDFAFNGCISLTSVTIPNSVTSIGQYAFAASGLFSIKIPNTVENIGDYAFSRCCGLTSIEIPSSVTSIEEGAFYQCTDLTSITIPDSVINIEKNAFAGCSKLLGLLIPNTVTYIGEHAFEGCPIEKVALPKSAKYYPNSFDKRTKIENLKVFISYSWDNEEHKVWVEKLASDLNKSFHVFLDQWDMRAGSDLGYFAEKSISDSNYVLCILTPTYKKKCDNFGNGTGYEAAIMKDEIRRNNSKNKFIPVLRSGNWNESCPLFLMGNVGLDMRTDNQYEKILNLLLRDLFNYSFKRDCSSPLLIINDGKTIIGVTNKSLSSVTIPNSVNSIRHEAFKDCTNLTSVFIPDSVTSIGDKAFWGCIKLETIRIPNSLIEIGEHVFEGCPIKEVIISESIKGKSVEN